MNKARLTVCFLVAAMSFSHAQNVAINTTGAGANASALLDIGIGTAAAGGDIKGILIPRVALTGTNDVATITSGNVTSLLVYNSATVGTGTLSTDVSPGYYYWNGTKWVAFSGNNGKDWSLLGNAGTVDATNFLGTTDNIPFNLRVNNQKAGRIDPTLFNVFFGYHAGNANTTGNLNTFIGHNAGLVNTNGTQNTAVGYGAFSASSGGVNNTAVGTSALNSTTADENTAVGFQALNLNSSGLNNTAVGSNALANNTIASGNTAVGYYSLYTSTGVAANNTAMGFESLRANTGSKNTAFGTQALKTNIGGTRNSAVGDQSLKFNSSGNDNTAAGYAALDATTTGFSNTAVGSTALLSNTSGISNTAFGFQAGFSNTTGSSNVAIGPAALYSNTDRRNLVAVGDSALYNNGVGAAVATDATLNTAVGSKALYANTTGHYNTATGYKSLNKNTTGSFNTAFGIEALFNNLGGDYNTAVGYLALWQNTSGTRNNALGVNALQAMTIGGSNNGFGQFTTFNTIDGSNNVAMGDGAMNNNVSGSNNTAIGFQAGYGVLGSGSVFLGYQAGGAETGSNKLYIANTNGIPLIYGDFSTARIGLGTITPSWDVDLTKANAAGSVIVNVQNTSAGANAGAGFLTQNDASKWAELTIGSSNATTTTFGSANANIANFLSSTTIAFGNTGNAPIIFGTNNLERMRLMGNGSLRMTGTSITSPAIWMEGTVTDAAGGALGILSRGILTPTANNIWMAPFVSNFGTVNSGTYTGLVFYGMYMDASTWVKTGTGTIANGYGLYVTAPTFATANYAGIFTGGNVGIGTTTPGSALEVNGQVKITGGTPGLGKVLTSDAVGLASWSNGPTVAGSGFMKLLNNDEPDQSVAATTANVKSYALAANTYSQVMAEAEVYGVGGTWTFSMYYNGVLVQALTVNSTIGNITAGVIKYSSAATAAQNITIDITRGAAGTNGFITGFRVYGIY